MKLLKKTQLFFIVILVSTLFVRAQDIRPVNATDIVKKSYSPFANRSFPTQVYWGDTHLHTANSLDARSVGVILTADDAFRFAKGEEITASKGMRIKLGQRLDWLVVSDHSDAMGTMDRIIKGDPQLLTDEVVKSWNQRLNSADQQLVFNTGMEVVEYLSQGKAPAILLGKDLQKTVWDEHVETADKHNEPGKFTAFIGYEWTSTDAGNNLHRNVVYRGDADEAKRVLPLTTAEKGFNPEALWEWMGMYEEKTGGRVLALAHNGNLSNGIMFPVESNPATGKPLTKEYLANRSRWEPLYEVTQIKGDGEAHPYLSPNDEFADFGTWDIGNFSPTPKTDNMLQYEYAREALKNGLKIDQEQGINPYKFGMVGATDSHTGLSTAEESNFFGKHSGEEPNKERIAGIMMKFGDSEYPSWSQQAAGYQGVWATENTREALWDAMMRKETYATTGPRIVVRFFGGWDFVDADGQSRLPAEVGYQKGVPMGGDLTNAPSGQSPKFLVYAVKDPYSANLDRIQIVKGWVDKRGRTYEKVYGVAWSDDRKPDANGKVPSVGSTVDLENVTWTNTIGDPELITVWEDPDFDPGLRAFYYARVIEIPTPRWTAYDAKYFGTAQETDDPKVHQERAYTSPIWYTPE